MVNILRATAISSAHPVAFFSLQMPAQRVILRLVASLSEVDSQKMRLGYLGEKDFPKIAGAAGKLVEAPIFIDETPRMSVSEIAVKAKNLKMDKNVRVLIVDSLQQIMTHDGSDPAASLKSLARELQIPIVVTSNISAKADRRRDKRPVLQDLESTHEQEADVILFLYRDEIYNPGYDNRNELDLILAKNRNGDTGVIKTWYIPGISMIRDFVDCDEEYVEDTEDKP